MTTHEPTFAHTTDDEILALVLNRAPGIPASVAQQLADHLRSQSERIVWLEHEATELRGRVVDKVQVFGGTHRHEARIYEASGVAFEADAELGDDFQSLLDEQMRIEALILGHQATVADETVVKPTWPQRVWYWWNTP